jgi:hypothetical protein
MLPSLPLSFALIYLKGYHRSDLLAAPIRSESGVILQALRTFTDLPNRTSIRMRASDTSTGTEPPASQSDEEKAGSATLDIEVEQEVIHTSAGVHVEKEDVTAM